MPATAGECHAVLFISACADDHASIQKIFGASPWRLQVALTGRDGLGVIRRTPQEIPVVICEDSLPDGDWKWLLAELNQMLVRPRLIVSSRLADERLWAEVLNLGAFDLLQREPFEPEEVLRVTESAWRASHGNPAGGEIRHVKDGSSQTPQGTPARS